MDIDEVREETLEFLEKELELSPGDDFGVDEDGDPLFRLGDTEVNVVLDQTDGEGPSTVTFVTCLGELPEEHLVRVYRKLLELNLQAPAGFAVGVDGNSIIVRVTADSASLDGETLRLIIMTVVEFTREWSAKLVGEYGVIALKTEE